MKLFNLFNNIKETLTLEPSEAETIQMIHNDFDSAYDREQKETEELLASLDIPLESDIEKKAERLSALGFTKSVVVEKATSLKQKRKDSEQTVKMLKSTAQLLAKYKSIYPFQQFLTFKELERICKKWNLTFAPVSAYKMDVPEKNLKEIENAQKLKDEHKMETQYVLNGLKDMSLMRALGKNSTVFTEKEILDLLDKYYFKAKNYRYYQKTNPWGIKSTTWLYAIHEKFSHLPYESYNFTSVTEINRSGLYICAPKSEFDLTGLTENEFGYLPVTTKEIKDPIVFEFCKGSIVRILSKWGLPENEESLNLPINN